MGGNGDVEGTVKSLNELPYVIGPSAPVLRAPNGRRRPGVIADLKPYAEYGRLGCRGSATSPGTGRANDEMAVH